MSNKFIFFKLALCCAALILSACQAPKPGLLASSKLNSADNSVAIEQDVYPVGSSTFYIHDQSRPFDAVADADKGVRTLLTEVWYPAQVNNIATARVARYGDYVFGDRKVHKKMMSKTTFFHLTPATVRQGSSAQQLSDAAAELFERPRGSYIDAPLVNSDQPFPVIVMSHGDAGSRYNMQTVCEYLAAHGYIVIAAEHTGNSPYSQIGRDPMLQLTGELTAVQKKIQENATYLDSDGVYGDEKTWGQTYIPDGAALTTPEGLIKLDQVILERVNDLRAVLVYLDSANQQGRFAHKIDTQRIGLMGRSFGGLTTLAGLALEDRFKAGMAVVPPALPDIRTILPKTILKAEGVESILLNNGGPFALTSLHKPTLLLSSAEDKIIIAANQALQPLTGLAAPTVSNPHPLLRQIFEQSRVPALWGLLDNANHGSPAVSGPYWWPQLKPQVFNRVLRPKETYTLMDSNTAHKIQKEKALLFFDQFVKGDDSGSAELLINPFGEQGLRWRSKNIK